MRRHVVHYCGLCCVVFYLGCGASLMNGLQAVPQWETSNKPSVRPLDLISARLFLTVSVTPFVASWINDLWGRKLCLGGPVDIGSVFECSCQRHRHSHRWSSSPLAQQVRLVRSPPSPFSKSLRTLDYDHTLQTPATRIIILSRSLPPGSAMKLYSGLTPAAYGEHHAHPKHGRSWSDSIVSLSSGATHAG